MGQDCQERGVSFGCLEVCSRPCGKYSGIQGQSLEFQARSGSLGSVSESQGCSRTPRVYSGIPGQISESRGPAGDLG